MAKIVMFPCQNMNERLEPLRDFLDDAEAERRGTLNEEELDGLQAAIDHVWPGVVAIEQSWITKLVFTIAGFAIGFGIHP